jgi:hypothetical protein
MSAPDDSGFLSRWARRKAEARRGMADVATAPSVASTPAPHASVTDTHPVPSIDAQARSAVAAEPAEPATKAPPPTLDDVAELTRDSDYARFVARDVDPGVRNAAMRKLFTDPHFNVMDGLDVYIDDYNTPDPLPPGMLRQMAQSQMLGLFDHEKNDEPDSTPPTATPAAAAAPDAQTAPSDEDPDLRLQPDDAAGLEPHEPDRASPVEDPERQR